MGDESDPSRGQQGVLGHTAQWGLILTPAGVGPPAGASNVCFEVQDVPTVSQSLQERGCPLAIPPTDVTDSGGSVTYCVVRSVVGNISHTLLDCSRYRGAFLPGFRAMGDVPEGLRDPAEATHFDHITYACSRGSTQAVLDWYQHCFGFQRFIMNRQGDVAEGYRIHGHGVGLRLTAMRYRKGSEPRLVDDCKFVLAESLPEPGKNQVDAFLEQHGGAGIQHVALYTTDIVSTARALAQAGVRFVEPPQAYYSEAGKAEEIRAAGQDPWLLSQHGILLDTEYLMQIFTKPIFPEETFFLELIEQTNPAPSPIPALPTLAPCPGMAGLANSDFLLPGPGAGFTANVQPVALDPTSSMGGFRDCEPSNCCSHPWGGRWQPFGSNTAGVV
uniref:4-hydroxyphenylpyruvate dioxygenase n=1 Tax=Gopherus evgoodei TaxID=1825980 RepID=A0A8C4WEC7_9SAUR